MDILFWSHSLPQGTGMLGGAWEAAARCTYPGWPLKASLFRFMLQHQGPEVWVPSPPGTLPPSLVLSSRVVCACDLQNGIPMSLQQ
jgi:hypothetical protein